MHHLIGPKPHNILLYRSQNCSFKTFQKLTKLFAYNLEPDAIINICSLYIIIHNFLSDVQDRLHYFSCLYLFPIIVFEIHNFAIHLAFSLTFFFPMWYVTNFKARITINKKKKPLTQKGHSHFTESDILHLDNFLYSIYELPLSRINVINVFRPFLSSSNFPDNNSKS